MAQRNEAGQSGYGFRRRSAGQYKVSTAGVSKMRSGCESKVRSVTDSDLTSPTASRNQPTGCVAGDEAAGGAFGAAVSAGVSGSSVRINGFGTRSCRDPFDASTPIPMIPPTRMFPARFAVPPPKFALVTLVVTVL